MVVVYAFLICLSFYVLSLFINNTFENIVRRQPENGIVIGNGKRVKVLRIEGVKLIVEEI